MPFSNIPTSVLLHLCAARVPCSVSLPLLLQVALAVLTSLLLLLPLAALAVLNGLLNGLLLQNS